MNAHAVPAYAATRLRRARSDACVVIPVIDEGPRIARTLDRMRLLGIAAIADILIVDGGSRDGSLDPALLDRAGVTALLVKSGPGRLGAQLRCAYDFALREGYARIVTIDGNDKDDPAAIPHFLAALDAGVDFVQASRFVTGGVERNTPWRRRLAIRLIHAPMLSIASGFHWTDTTQGFRAYRRALLADPALAIFRDVFAGYELLPYLNYRAPRLGYRCAEIGTSRIYPAGERAPTKIDRRAEIGLLGILWKACRGGYDPR